MLLAVCAVLAVNSAAASPAHQHSVAAGSDCELCCVGHLPALQTPCQSDLRPGGNLNWQPAIEPQCADLDPRSTAASGRAPPL